MKYYKATKKWHCDCQRKDCSHVIDEREFFTIDGNTGEFFKKGHEIRKPKIVLSIKKANK